MDDNGSVNVHSKDIIDNNEGRVTYFGYDKYDTGLDAGEAFQVKQPRHLNPMDPKDKSWSDSRLRSEFDTLQLYGKDGHLNARVPREFSGQVGALPEPFTKAYPGFGKGGAQQVHADGATIKFDKVDILPEK